jgi:hypothetical protein
VRIKYFFVAFAVLCNSTYAQSDAIDRLLFEDVESSFDESPVPTRPLQMPTDTDDSPIAIGPFQEIQEKIDESARLLRSGQADSSTLELQRNILSALEALVDQTAANDSADPSEADPNATDESADSGSSPGTVTDSDTGTGAPSADPVELSPDAAREKLLDRAWGHLPPATIDRLKSTGTVEFMPSYRERIEAYFNRLGKLRSEER